MRPIFLFGAAGRVGHTLLRFLVTSQSAYNIVGLAEKDNFIFEPEGISDEILARCATSNTEALTCLSEHQANPGLLEIFAHIQESKIADTLISIDATAGRDEMRDYHLAVIQESEGSIVTANKNPLSLYENDVFVTLTTERHRYQADTTVMAGAGTIPFIIDRAQVGDSVTSLQGSFSGTLTYIFSEFMKSSRPFSEVVQEAYEQGITEPHPWDDLNGLDVARKLLILARYLGRNINLDDLQVTAVLPEQFGSLAREDFFRLLPEADNDLDILRKEALSRGNTLQYVAQYSPEKLSVGIQELPKDSELGTLIGTQNICIAQTEAYASPVPHVIKTRGAGLEVTARSLQAQIHKSV